jgi:hypothetical protein
MAKVLPVLSSVILWEGPSPVDGAPIVAIATGLTGESTNRKTGRMAQVAIVRQDVSPITAINTGEDVSICGGCPHRKGGKYGKRTCYVNVAKGVGATWRSYAEGNKVKGGIEHTRTAGIRMGSYGDPALIPADIWDAVTARDGFHTAYTHMWRSERLAGHLRGRAMASCETAEDVRKANANGWGTFRVIAEDAPAPTTGTECPADGDRVTCETCRACDGTAGRNVWIRAHGVASKRVTEGRVCGE